MAEFKRIFLITALSLIGLAVVLTLVGMIGVSRWAGPGPATGGEAFILSALCIGYLVIASFAAFVALERPYVRWIAVSGMLLAVVLLVEAPVFIWFSLTFRSRAASPLDQQLASATGTGLVLVGFLCGLAFVLAPRMNLFGRVVQFATVVAMLTVTVCFGISIWGDWSISRYVEEALPASLLLSGAGMAGVWILHKFFGIKVKDVLSDLRETIYLRCPRCLKEQDAQTGEWRCVQCKLLIKIEVEEPRCPKCGYSLHQLTHPVCPECGQRLREAEVTAAVPAT